MSKCIQSNLVKKFTGSGHTAFLNQFDSYLEKFKSAKSFEGLRLKQIFEILNSNTTPNKFLTE